MIALPLSVPLLDWLMPCENSVTTRSVLAKDSETPHLINLEPALPGDRGDRWCVPAPRPKASLSPWVWSRTKPSASTLPCSASQPAGR